MWVYKDKEFTSEMIEDYIGFVYLLTNKQNGMMWDIGRDYALYAELFIRKGEQSKAKANLKKAIKIFKECSAYGWVRKYEKELAKLKKYS